MESKKDDNDKDNDEDDGFEVCFVGDPIVNDKGGVFKSYRREKWFETKNRMQFINITKEIEQMLKQSRISDGIILVSPMHITGLYLIFDIYII